ncbi:hypothetical protein F2Q70_00026663 [Brassica cretica]|uniref:PUM-HD domain-containing protein n=1 Tax=Brassica cretica TaxID=69181 RepID=A0A8S9L011_BRACR|nr:hypothetical protein F2Q70_00026663 [Brassica cretica]
MLLSHLCLLGLSLVSPGNFTDLGCRLRLLRKHLRKWRQRLEKQKRGWRSNYSKPLFLSGKFQLFFHDFINRGADSIRKSFRIGIQKKKAANFGQVLPHAYKLMTDVFGNYVIPKVLHIIKPDQRVRLASELDGQVLRCVRNQNGNHVIQKGIHNIPAD